MVDDFLSQPQDRGTSEPKRNMRIMLGIGATAFILGVVLTGWLATRDWSDWYFWDDDKPQMDVPVAVIGSPTPTPTPEATLSAKQADRVEQAAETVEKAVEKQGGFDQRLAALEQRLARLDLQAQAASGNAARAEGLLIAFATRRAIERAAPLGYLADQLRLRFGDARPNAVATLIAASANPITLDQLTARLEGLSQYLTKAPIDESVWKQTKRELNNLFVIRRETGPSPAPRRRLERARMFLESGRVEAAVAEVRNMPGAEDAGGWIADAERYAAAQAALNLIETAAVLEPRNLRDGSGEKVEQPSPATEAG